MNSLKGDSLQYMDYMFQGCKLLPEADLTSITDAPGLQSTAFMFANCDVLANVAFGDTFNQADPNQVTALATVESMFQNCPALTTVNLQALMPRSNGFA